MSTKFRWTSQVAYEQSMQSIKMQVLEYLASPIEEAVQGYFQTLHRPERYRQVVIHTSQSSVAVLQPGALQYLKGNIDLEAGRTSSGAGLGGLLRGAVTAAAASDSLFKTFYKGQGEIYIEPSHMYFLVNVLEGEELIIDDGAFLACAGQINVERHVHKNLMNALGNGEGLVQTKLSGRGLFALKSPVPPDEFQIVHLENDTLKVDGHLAIAYSGSLNFNVETSAKSLLATVKTGEGFLQVFRGTGRVWLLPTKGFHHQYHE